MSLSDLARPSRADVRADAQRDARPSIADSGTYDALLRVRSDAELLVRVEAQLEDWLRRKKNWDPPTETSGYHRGPNDRELLVLHQPAAKAGRSFRARLREPNHKTGTWTTTLTVHESRSADSWVRLRVNNSQGRYVNVPQLAGFLLDALDVYDGDTWLSSSPKIIHASSVDAFAEQLTGLDRSGLHLVAGTADDPDIPFDVFCEQVAGWTRETVGLAQVTVLDPAATMAFNTIMGRDHAAPPWAIRTFRPDVDPAGPMDGRRHRVLGLGRLVSESDGSVRKLLGRIARRHAAEQTPPQRFVAVDRALIRLEDTVLLDDLYHGASSGPIVAPVEPGVGNVPTPRDPAPRAGAVPEIPDLAQEVAGYLAQIENAKAVLGVVDLSPESLDRVAGLLARERESGERVSRRLDERRQQIEELTDEVALYRELSDDLESDMDDAATALADAADEIRWLRGRLRDLAQYDAAAALLPDEDRTDRPDDFAELADRLEAGGPAGVVFTGCLKQVRSLAEHDMLGRIARDTWDVVLLLSDYVRAREEGLCEHGVKHYLDNTPQGFRTLSRKRFAEKESGQTMRSWGDDRMFPVPCDVDPAGSAVMEAHFKLGHVGMVSPRLYYLDDWCRTGRVYIGYIGRHLRNTQTN